MNERIIILDRDGVINFDSDAYIKSADEWIPIPGSLEAIARLTRAGYRVLVVTNQAGIGRGLFEQPTLDAIHDKMKRMTAQNGGSIDEIFFCPHAPEDQCACRKPRPGLYHAIANQLGTDLHNIPSIGDSLRDVQAALAAGARPILVRTGNGRETETLVLGMDVPVYDDLAAAVDDLLATDHQ